MGEVAAAIRGIEDRIGDPELWAKNRFRVTGLRYKGKPAVAFCLIGALNDLGVPRPVNIATWAFLNEVLEGFSNVFPLVANLSWFNDNPSTTHDDLMLFLATALDVAEVEGL